jgi:hypothetical protein
MMGAVFTLLFAKHDKGQANVYILSTEAPSVHRTGASYTPSRIKSRDTLLYKTETYF